MCFLCHLGDCFCIGFLRILWVSCEVPIAVTWSGFILLHVPASPCDKGKGEGEGKREDRMLLHFQEYESEQSWKYVYPKVKHKLQCKVEIEAMVHWIYPQTLFFHHCYILVCLLEIVFSVNIFAISWLQLLKRKLFCYALLWLGRASPCYKLLLE